jgi:hypothetical protein
MASGRGRRCVYLCGRAFYRVTAILKNMSELCVFAALREIFVSPAKPQKVFV